MKPLGLALLSATIAAGPAFAGGLAPVAPEPAPLAPAPYQAPARDWTGAYLGGQLGYGSLGGDVSGSGAIGGLFGGYTHDFGGWALGGELGYDRANIDVSAGGAPIGKLRDVTRLKLRAGPTFGDTFVYGTVGGVHARLSQPGGGSLSDTGWLAGVGVEHALNRNWSIGGEVLHHRIGNFDGTGLSVRPTTAQLRATFRF